MDTPHRRAALIGAIALILLAGCLQVGSITQSEAPGGPSLGAPSITFVEPSETEEPSLNQPPGHGALTGSWEGTWVIDGYGTTGGFTMELVQEGDAFSGTVAMTNTDCSNGTVEGEIHGASVEFGWITSTQPVHFEGNLNGSAMSGTWSALACSDGTTSLTGTWEATKR
jgi:hypothetical protein